MIKPTVSQILFSLSFVLSQIFYPNGIYSVLLAYVFFLWLWLTVMARKTSKHPVAEKYGKTLMNVNLGCSVILIISIPYFLIMLAAIKAVVVLFSLSCLVHILVIMRNMGVIAPEKNKVITFLQLLFYPWGVWTIQNTLRQEKR